MNEKAQATRERNKAARAAQREAREAQEKADKALCAEALRAVLRDPDATAAQRLYAVAALDNMCYYNFVPYGVKHPDESIATFAAELEAAARE